jgi:uncharacterized protein YcgL (UPF0745 family)
VDNPFMNCTVYRSANRDFTYIYLREGFSFEDLPEQLQSVFGTHEPVLDLELSPGRPLAQEDVSEVMDNLERQGYHLQLPPRDDPDGWLELPQQKDN